MQHRTGRSEQPQSGVELLKEAIQRKELVAQDKIGQGKLNYLNYLDNMQKSLNMTIQASVFPHWRNH